MGKIKSKKVVIDGVEFDSKTEGEYYLFLCEQENVKGIELQPQFTLIHGFCVECGECKGTGEGVSLKTGRKVQCKRCRGTGVKDRQSWSYRADFKVTYQDGKTEVIDVKGYANERFPLVKKMFEYVTGQELVVVKKVKGEWVRK